MVMEYRNATAAVLIMLMVLSIGCATSRKQRRVMRIPPGLDSTTVVRASRMAEENFVSAKREQEAVRQRSAGKENLEKVDEFWAYLEQRVKKDNLTRAQENQFDRELAKGAQALSKWKTLTKNGKDEKALVTALQYCLRAQEHLETAIRINPFDKNARLLLAAAYYNLQHIFGKQGNHAKAVQILERLTRIEKGEPDIYRLLAENYMALKDYEKALKNFQKAEIVLVKTSFAEPPDTSMLFYYAYMQGDMYARLYDANAALKNFKAASTYARTKQEKADVENYIKWIDWDGGNIRASEKWDELLALESQKQYNRMAAVAAKVIPILRTKKAKLAVYHRLAVVEFEFLDRQAKAVERMKQVYEAIKGDLFANNMANHGKGANSSNGHNQKSEEIKAYLNTYGAMLYRLGVEALEKQQKKLALAYFTKAVEFEWDQVAKPYVELVALVWNSPEKAIRYGERALAMADGVLSGEESCNLLSMMVKAHKSAGLYDRARDYFEKWKQCQE